MVDLVAILEIRLMAWNAGSTTQTAQGCDFAVVHNDVPLGSAKLYWGSGGGTPEWVFEMSLAPAQLEQRQYFRVTATAVFEPEIARGPLVTAPEMTFNLIPSALNQSGGNGPWSANHIFYFDGRAGTIACQWKPKLRRGTPAGGEIQLLTGL